MNYKFHYDCLIEKAKCRTTSVYTETHHVIPRCIGGLDSKYNLIELTPEEHYVAHQLLVKIYPGNAGLVFAAHRMCSGKARNNKLYGWLRRLHAEAMSELHTGKVISPESRKRMSESHKGILKSNETRQNMIKSQQNRSPEIRKNMSDAHMGHAVSDETKEKIREANIGRKHTTETCKKMSASHLGEKNHFFNKIHTEEAKAKMKAIRKKQVVSEETKQKISETCRRKRELKLNIPE